ncbi:MAG: asparagine synthase (glutamine-hydrolyzing) [Anaerolineae bacterium]|nr:asparagine synthase (glutamine-hydrolyzing) [Anaerolineae bacterium]
MCGIAGFITPSNTSTPTNVIQAMVVGLQHRGPDGSNIWQHEIGEHHLAFGHTRLAILDLTDTAQQPMIDSETGCVLIYNGELYNFHDLRAELLSLGERPFNSTGDTEVLLRAYTRWGKDFVKKLRGMFAFCIYDPQLRQLFLGRDHLGIKPLYITQSPHQQFAFASEVRPLLNLPWSRRIIDAFGLMGYLAYGSVQGPNTLISGIQSLPPAHTLTVDVSEDIIKVHEPQRYWQLTPAPVSSSFADAASQVSIALEDSLRLHLLSDAPLGVFLSGGIDSSSIVALMAQVAPEHIHTLTIAFSEANFDESRIASSVANHYGTHHTEINLSANDFLTQLPSFLASFDQPSSDGANTWMISQACRQVGIKVALSGLGADELFAGYSTFTRTSRAAQTLPYIDWIPQFGRNLLANLLSSISNSTRNQKLSEWLRSDGSNLSTYLILRRLFLAPTCQALLDPEYLRQANETMLSQQVVTALKTYSSTDDSVTAVSLLEMNTYLVNTLLRDSDQMGMAHSLEIRIPFVDYKLAELVMSFSGATRTHGVLNKPLLRAAMEGKLNAAWIDRPKMGFSFPFDIWLRGVLREEIERSLMQLSGFPFQPGAVIKLWKQFLSGSNGINSSQILVLYALANWMQKNQVVFLN